MAERRVLWSPTLDREVTPIALHIIDLYRRGIIGITEFERRMRRAGYTPTEAWILLGEYERGELEWRVIPPPIPRPLIAITDSMTGYLIVLFEAPIKGEKVWLYDEEAKELIEPVKTLRIEKTFSVDTEGHESLLAEVTIWTIIKAEDIDEIKEISDRMEDKAKSWFLAQFTNYTREGIPVIPNFKIREDFRIQEEEYGATYEMTIAEWFMTATGEWQEKPRILKEGFGAYTTDQKPTWPTCYIYVEYSHEKEPHPAHRIPPAGEEIIDP